MLRQPKNTVIELPPVDKIPGRMALLVTTFLMLVNISSTERNKGPVVRRENEIFTCGEVDRSSRDEFFFFLSKKMQMMVVLNLLKTNDCRKFLIF